MTAANSAPGPSASAGTERWTALEVFTAIAPHRVSRLSEPHTAFDAVTRRAHVVALSEGLQWDPAGRYPLDVWMKVFR